MDGARNLAALRWLTSDEGLEQLELLRTRRTPRPADIMNLRRRWGEDRATWLTLVATVQHRVAEKFGPGIAQGTDRAFQQATDRWVARYKASRYPTGVPVVDVCCGVGGDLQALRGRGPVVGVDADPALCVMAAANLAAWSNGSSHPAALVCQRAEEFAVPDGVWIHIDPDRRPDQNRASNPEYYQPPVAVLDRLLDQSLGGAIKLAPAAEVPEHWCRRAAEREWISRRGSCRQQVVWFRPGWVRHRIAATVVDGGDAQTFSAPGEALATARVSDADRPSQWMLDFDPAVRAAGLTAVLASELGLHTIGGPAGFFTCEDRPTATTCGRQPIDRLATRFHVLWSGPMDEKRLRRMISERNPRSLEIKIRGVDLRPETLRPKLLKRQGRAAADSDLVLLVGRRGSGQSSYAALAERDP